MFSKPREATNAVNDDDDAGELTSDADSAEREVMYEGETTEEDAVDEKSSDYLNPVSCCKSAP
jgi:hypothetical protein